MPDSVKWFGDKVEKQIIGALSGGVGKSSGEILADARKDWPVDTGKSRAAMSVSDPKRDGDEVFSAVFVPVDYAVFVELKKKVLRRAMMKNETSTLGNFEGALK